ncbi:hypothetical protein E1265_10505 [Streptomyces sp. 8K308]|uniref:ARPP-2 domain-containing protein n=1 Tax=Streptomyces sp. 8K308 TaxID=2530388 RepID=UPI00105143E6|nr:hypothetical protein [Streptomyces sp. 8K308]TDC24190.1 hypothetical protein E1265_10505 [Streptomyces sp. 8K308]
MTTYTPSGIDLAGLTTGPPQVWGGVRLVPLLREAPIVDLRLHPRAYGESIGLVDLDGRSVYAAYIPHGYVASWTGGGPAAAYGTQLTDGRTAGTERAAPVEHLRLHFHRRMARRENRNRLRFLPLHLALEGYLALHFGGPTIVWDEWARRAVNRGLSPRVERAYVGAEVPGLADALRVFEVHPGQCGTLIYVADALAGALVVPHPDDYRVLHPTLIRDLYGELVHQYALLSAPVQEFRARLDDSAVRTLADLRAAVAGQRAEWAAFHDQTMAGGLLDAEYSFQRVYRLGRFSLWRFLPPFRRRVENHIGECVLDSAGRLAYLKTFRLSEAQVRRGHLLSSLAAHDWHLANTAVALGITAEQLSLRVEHAGFGQLLVHRRRTAPGIR